MGLLQAEVLEADGLPPLSSAGWAERPPRPLEAVENCETDGVRVSESLGKGQGLMPKRNGAGLFPKPQAPGLSGLLSV